MIGFMLDSARALDQRSYYTRFIDFIADRGCDTLLLHFSDDQGCSLRFNAFPESACRNAYTHEQMRELVEYAKARRINIIPELASLGHTRYLTHSNGRYADLAETEDWFSSMCPVSSRTRTLIASLLDETLSVFDSPIVHVGLDEVNLGGHALTKEALKTQSEADLFADYVRFLHAHLTRNGRRMMMWGDYLVANSQVLEQIPRDILIANWQYDPDVTPDATQRLVDAGFEVVSCPALISHNQPILPGESFAYPNVRKMTSYRDLGDRVVGVMTTIWTPPRFMSDTLWPAVDYAAALMRDGADIAVREQAGVFGCAYFGIEEPAAFAEAMERLADFAPRRSAWLPLLELDRKALAQPQLESQHAELRSLSRVMQHCRRQVTREREAFDRLVLLCELFDHVWARAIAMRDDNVSRDIVETSERIGSQLSDAWDRERFGDDPRKRSASTSHDKTDSLLLMYARGLKVLRGAWDATPVPSSREA